MRLIFDFGLRTRPIVTQPMNGPCYNLLPITPAPGKYGRMLCVDPHSVHEHAVFKESVEHLGWIMIINVRPANMLPEIPNVTYAYGEETDNIPPGHIHLPGCPFLMPTVSVITYLTQVPRIAGIRGYVKYLWSLGYEWPRNLPESLSVHDTLIRLSKMYTRNIPEYAARIQRAWRRYRIRCRLVKWWNDYINSPVTAIGILVYASRLNQQGVRLESREVLELLPVQ